MNNDKHPLDQAARILLDEYEHTPPHYVWDDLQASLRDAKRRRRRTILWYAAASWLVIISFSTGYFMQSSSDNEVIIAQATKPSIQINGIKFVPTARPIAHGFTNKRFVNIPHVLPVQNPTIAYTAIIEPQNKSITNSPTEITTTTVALLDSAVTDSAALVRAFVLAAGTAKISDSANQAMSISDYNAPMYADASNDMQNWQFGGGATPLYSFSNNTSADASGSGSGLKNGAETNTPANVEQQTKPSIYTSGMYVKRSLSKNIKIRSGFYYNRIISGSSTSNGVEIPMIGELGIVNSKHLQVSVNSGVGAGMEAQSWYPYSMGGVSIAVPLSPSMHVNVEPMFKHTFIESPLHNNNFLGVFTGVSYSF